MDHPELSSFTSYSSPRHRLGRWTMAHPGQVRPRELHLWLSPLIHAEQVHCALFSQALRRWIGWPDVRICFGIYNGSTTGRRPCHYRLSSPPANQASIWRRNHLEIRDTRTGIDGILQNIDK